MSFFVGIGKGTGLIIAFDVGCTDTNSVIKYKSTHYTLLNTYVNSTHEIGWPSFHRCSTVYQPVILPLLISMKAKSITQQTNLD